jgi:hypothetical protein
LFRARGHLRGRVEAGQISGFNKRRGPYLEAGFNRNSSLRWPSHVHTHLQRGRVEAGQRRRAQHHALKHVQRSSGGERAAGQKPHEAQLRHHVLAHGHPALHHTKPLELTIKANHPLLEAGG